MDNMTFAVNVTLSELNGTTPRGPTPRPVTPPPLGYYGDTKEMLWKVIPPIIMVLGTVGNLLTFLVLLRQKSKLSSTALYLMALAVSDTIVLYTGPLRHWLEQLSDYDIRGLTDAGCKIQVYITYASLHCSSWLLVAVTSERALSVVLPHKVRLSCTPRTACIVIFSIFIFTYGINIINPVIYGSDAYRSTVTCGPTTKEYLDFRADVYHWIDLLVVFVLPFIILLAGNVIIIVYLQKSRISRKAMAATREQKGATSGRDTRSVSVLLIALCIIFFLTMTPSCIFSVYFPRKEDEIFELFATNPRKAWYDFQFLMFQHAVVNLVSYTNAAFNFILYVFSGTKFRGELQAMFCCDKAVTSGVFGSKVSKSSSKTRTTSFSATKTQVPKGQLRYLNKESRNVEGYNVPTESNSNGVTDSEVFTITVTSCEKQGHTDNSSATKDQSEKVFSENGNLPHSSEAEVAITDNNSEE